MPPAAAGDSRLSITVEAGAGQGVDLVGAGVRSPDLRVWTVSQHCQAALSLLGRLDYWRGQNPEAKHRELWDFSATAVLRLRLRSDAAMLLPYLQAGLGAHLVTSVELVLSLGS